MSAGLLLQVTFVLLRQCPIRLQRAVYLLYRPLRVSGVVVTILW